MLSFTHHTACDGNNLRQLKFDMPKWDHVTGLRNHMDLAPGDRPTTDSYSHVGYACTLGEQETATK